MSKSRIDRLGLRLREGTPSEADLRELSDYRATFAPAYRHVLTVVRDRLRLEPTGRPAKSTAAIIDKLRRESIRLTQIQDIAGLRLVVPSVFAQDAVVDQLTDLFERTMEVDRRIRPSHGYRAVHVIAFVEGVPVEIQVRTAFQHRWAELSEKLSDLLGHSIKYGGGDPQVRQLLLNSSDLIAGIEGTERQLAFFDYMLEQLGHPPSLTRDVDNLRRDIVMLSANASIAFDAMMHDFRRLSGES